MVGCDTRQDPLMPCLALKALWTSMSQSGQKPNSLDPAFLVSREIRNRRSPGSTKSPETSRWIRKSIVMAEVGLWASSPRPWERAARKCSTSALTSKETSARPAGKSGRGPQVEDANPLDRFRASPKKVQGRTPFRLMAGSTQLGRTRAGPLAGCFEGIRPSQRRCMPQSDAATP